jgi:UTP--glucose-1-phosphate uridylyltransferase
VFEGATAIEVGRERFLPVKTTNDLLVLRSDVYELTDDYRLVARVDAPLVKLSGVYKTIGRFDERFPAGAPSLREAASLTVEGDWTFGSGVRVVGEGRLADAGELQKVPDGAVVTSEGIQA